MEIKHHTDRKSFAIIAAGHYINSGLINVMLKLIKAAPKHDITIIPPPTSIKPENYPGRRIFIVSCDEAQTFNQVDRLKELIKTKEITEDIPRLEEFLPDKKYIHNQPFYKGLDNRGGYKNKRNRRF